MAALFTGAKKMEANQVSIDGWMGKKDVVCTDSAILA